MASEDIIELGSSDEDTQPAPKKMRPMPNAMVHIPSGLHGVTIKPTKQIALKKTVSSTKIPNRAATAKLIPRPAVIANAHLMKAKFNGKAVQAPAVKQPIKIQYKQIPITKPVGVMKISNAASVNFAKTAIRVQSPKALNKLPPSITVTRTSAAIKRLNNATMSNVNKKQKIVPAHTVGEVLTVELDDDETPTPSATGPQWYLRPEEQEEKTIEESVLNEQLEKIQEKNDEEPKPSKFIEITIEDSPVKPVQSKHTHDIGAELAITIDDSPAKPLTEKNDPASGSDGESNTPTKVPHSKKKLEYPKEAEVSTPGSFEIEIDPMPVQQPVQPDNDVDTNKDDETKDVSAVFNDIVEIEESPMKSLENHTASTPKKSSPVKPQLKAKEIGDLTQTYTEFHPIYQSFIDLCFQLENSNDMSKIVEKKIKAYYKQVPKEYTDSEEFVDMVSSKIMAMKAGPEKMYLYIKDIVDELNLQRKMAKSQVNKDTKSTEPEKFVFGEDSEYDSKQQRQIRKLEKTLRKLHRAIQKLEEQEVDFDDDEDSVYLLTERYKERMVRVHAKFCQLTNTKMPSEPRVQIDARPGQPTGPAKRLELWINRKVPIGTPLPFPDFHDVLRCVREANQKDTLGWNDADIMEEARDLFIRCGKKLQRRRQENEWRLAASRISLDLDPAETSDELRRKLEENKHLATKKEAEVLNKYADRQNLLKLEAVEIGDKEADESPVESEDEEPINESTSLENSEKRKERLKRLLYEKSKKNGSAKENELNKETVQVQKGVEIDSVVTNEDFKTANETDKGEEPNKENKTSLPEFPNNEKNKDLNDKEKTLSLSDDSNKVESDIDELHLLQKLHSENELNTSTLGSSDTDTPIAISDTLSSSDSRKRSSDVISIENSSYSESEDNKKDDLKNNGTGCLPNKTTIEKAIADNVEIECSIAGIEKKHNKSNNDEYNDTVENILLASSDEEVDSNKDNSSKEDDTCINLRDDFLSIGDTVIDKDHTQVENDEDVGSVESVELVGEKIDRNEKDHDDINIDIITTPATAESVEAIVDTMAELEEEVSKNNNQSDDKSVNLENNSQSDNNESVLENIISTESIEANVKVTPAETVMV